MPRLKFFPPRECNLLRPKAYNAQFLPAIHKQAITFRPTPRCFHNLRPAIPGYINFSIRPQKAYSTSPPSDPKQYTFEEVRHLSRRPDPTRLIIDVREPSELQETGRVPGALNMPITSNPDAFYLSEEEFFDRFGFEKPRARSMSRTGSSDIASSSSERKGPSQKSPYTPKMKQREADAGLNTDEGGSSEEMSLSARGEAQEAGEVDEVIFYCKAGVRSRAAARMASEWAGVKVGDMGGGWNEWSSKGGELERI